VAERLRAHGLGTLLFDLLTPDEERGDLATRQYRFDIALLAERLAAAVQWAAAREDMPAAIGLFGASTGAAAALIAAARLPDRVAAIVSRGGRPDLAGAALESVLSPTLLIVGGADSTVLELNRSAYRALRCERELAVIPGATHLFEEPGALDEVAERAAEWFVAHFAAPLRDAHE
jgi:pimeloyl-ACP methyl ester carboxylesterase